MLISCLFFRSLDSRVSKRTGPAHATAVAKALDLKAALLEVPPSGWPLLKIHGPSPSRLLRPFPAS